MSIAPAGHLCRFGQLRAWCGLPERTLRDIAETGRLGGAALWPGGKRFYLREIAGHVLLGAPFPVSPYGAEPLPALLRLADVLEWTGLHEDQFRWAEERLAIGRALRPGGKQLYAKHLIRAAFFAPLLPAWWQQERN